jgi:oxygen-dependent protoporphyrinogen oxidase
MPRFKELEKKHGSLLRAMRCERQRSAPTESSGARYSQFVAPREGMSSLVEGAARRLPPQSIRLSTPVAAIQPLDSGGWRLQVQGTAPGSVTVDGVILAAPAFEAARLLSKCVPTAARELQAIVYSSCALVSLGYRREQIGHPLDGFGFVVPRIEDRLILSCSFSSLKYPGRAPDGKVLLRVFIGGALQSHLLGLSDDDLAELARLELADLLAIRGEPIFRHVTRCRRALPQYYVGHCERVRRIERSLAQFPTLALAGSGLSGVGIPNCIRSGEQAVEQVFQNVCRRMPLAEAV